MNVNAIGSTTDRYNPLTVNAKAYALYNQLPNIDAIRAKEALIKFATQNDKFDKSNI